MKKKRKTIQPYKLTESGLIYNLPFLYIIKKRGFYWISETTVKQYDPLNTGLFQMILDAHNLKITKKNNKLNIFKITQNATNYN